jgi:hypothetical protein
MPFAIPMAPTVRKETNMRRMIAFAAAVALFAGPLAPAAFADDSLEQVLVESASTPKDHAALARYYEGKAAHARKEAESHRAMGKTYSGAKPPQVAAMKEHCDKLAAAAESEAKEYDALAAAHKDMAK